MSTSIEVSAALILAQKQVSVACAALLRANPLVKHLPQYKELADMVNVLGRIHRELQKEKL